jgi:hypothetical protein
VDTFNDLLISGFHEIRFEHGEFGFDFLKIDEIDVGLIVALVLHKASIEIEIE